jgi:hypothetical protein
MNATGAYPIVVYLPNAPAVTLSNPFLTNTSTYTLGYEEEEVVGFLDSAHANAIKGFPNPSTPTTPDSQYPLCLKCAVVDRARQRAGVNRSEACESCFNRCAFALFSFSSFYLLTVSCPPTQTAGPTPSPTCLSTPPTPRRATLRPPLLPPPPSRPAELPSSPPSSVSPFSPKLRSVVNSWIPFFSLFLFSRYGI